MPFFEQVKNIAQDMGHQVVLAEHILLAILANDESREVLTRMDSNLDLGLAEEQLKASVAQFPKKDNIKTIRSGATFVKLKELSERTSPSDSESTMLEVVLMTFSIIRRELEEGTRAPDSFEYLNIHKNEVALAKMLRGERVPEDDKEQSLAKQQESRANFDALNCKDFSKELFGKGDSVHQLLTHLTKQTGVTVLIGEEGSGKTTTLHKAISLVRQGAVSSLSPDVDFLSCRINKMASFDLNGRINGLITKAIEENSILVMENVHKYKLFADNSALSPTLLSAAEGGLKIILTMTQDCFDATFGKASGARTVSKIVLPELGLEDAKRIANDYLHQVYEAEPTHLQVNDLSKFTELVFENAKEEKLFNVIESIRHASASAVLSGLDSIDFDLLKASFSKVSSLEESKLSTEVRTSLINIEAEIRENIYGQDDAVTSIAKGVRLASLGLKESPKSPDGIFMLLGPTGVGKTETVYQLAECLNKPVVRLDMSEYQESHTLSKLLGSPSGYIGFNEGDGALLDQLKKAPDAIVLFDEIEKAHPKIHQLFLGLMDYGTLKTSTNKEVNLTNNLMFFTSNVGIDTKSGGGHFGLARSASGVESTDKKVSFNQSKYEKAFTPEFRARIDRQILFNPLDKEVAIKVVNKSLRKFVDNLSRRHSVEIAVSVDVIQSVVDRHFSEADGARKLKSGFEQDVISPVSELLICESPKKIEGSVIGDSVEFTVVE